MTEALGRSQVLEYLLDLSAEQHFHLISFERAQDLDGVASIEALIEGKNITWHRLNYSNKHGSLSTINCIWQAVRKGWRICKKYPISLIHCRSMIPTMMGWILKKRFGPKLLFDIRGFSTQEKVDRGRLQQGSLQYRFLMKMEDVLYKASDHVVTLTHKAKAILGEKYAHLSNHITVIPTCASKAVFKPISDPKRIEAIRLELGYGPEDILLIHTGTVSSWYNFDAELALVKALQAKDDRIQFLVLNKKEQVFIAEKLEEHGLSGRVQVTSAPFDRMYEFLNAADYSLFFIKTLYSKQASAPTKFAENVACLLPSITNGGVGDMERWLTQYKVGFLTTIEAVIDHPEEAASRFLDFHNSFEVQPNEFTSLFDEHFDKDAAVAHYQTIYDELSA